MKIIINAGIMFAAHTDTNGSFAPAADESVNHAAPAAEPVKFTDAELKDMRMVLMQALIETKAVTVKNGEVVINIADGEGLITPMPMELVCSITGTQILTVAKRMDKDAGAKMEITRLIEKMGKEKVAELLSAAS